MVNPTILVPGIQGTKLADVNKSKFDIKWSFFEKYYENLNDLLLNEESQYDKTKEVIIEHNELEYVAYDALINEVKSKDSIVYVFGYDWRKSNEFNGRLLYDFTAYLKQKLSAGENEPVNSFNFIAHSMGGMVFQCFLKILKEKNGNLDLVNKAAINACPYLGSITALKGIVAGEDGSEIRLFNASDSFRKIARTFPSVYEMLPVYPGSVKSKGGADLSLLEKNNWQTNVYDDIEPMFDNRLKMMNTFRDANNPAMLNFSSLTAEERKKFLILCGVNTKTKQSVIVDNINENFGVKNYIDFDSGTEDKNGDGIVRIESSAVYKDYVLTLLVERNLLEIAFHPMFLNDSRVQTIIKRFLFGTEDELKSPDWWKVRSNNVHLA